MLRANVATAGARCSQSSDGPRFTVHKYHCFSACLRRAVVHDCAYSGHDELLNRQHKYLRQSAHDAVSVGARHPRTQRKCVNFALMRLQVIDVECEGVRDAIEIHVACLHDYAEVPLRRNDRKLVVGWWLHARLCVARNYNPDRCVHRGNTRSDRSSDLLYNAPRFEPLGSVSEQTTGCDCGTRHAFD
jgi:hypothetical protein